MTSHVFNSIGQYIHKNKRRARYWLTKAAEGGHPRAQFGMARELLYDDKKHDENLIFEWTKKAAMQGDVEALSYLAFLYQWGSGVERNDKIAVAIYRDLAAINNLDGLYHLGHCYQYGSGVEKDLAEAERLYRKAIELGDIRAEIQLNDMLHPKRPIDEDVSENTEAKPSKHPIGKKLIICLLTTAIFSIAAIILSVVFFDQYAPFLKVYAGNKYTIFDGLFYKWPAVFIIMASFSIFAFLVTVSVARCKRKYGKDHIIMQNYSFKRMLPAGLAIMFFLIPAISRYCTGVSEYHLETGCIVGKAELYHNLYFSLECFSLVSAMWLTSMQMSLDLGPNLSETICRIIHICFSLIASCGMIYLNCRIQPWFIFPYLFVWIVIVIAIYANIAYNTNIGFVEL